MEMIVALIGVLICIYVVCMLIWTIIQGLLGTCDMVMLGLVVGLLPLGLGVLLSALLKGSALSGLRQGQLLAHLVQVRVKEQRWTCTLREGRIPRLCHLGVLVPLTVCGGVAFMRLGQVACNRLGLCESRTFPLMDGVSELSASGAYGWLLFWSWTAAVVSLGKWLCSNPHMKLAKEIQDYAANLMESFTTEVEGNGKLAAIARDVDALARELGISFPIDVENYAADLIATRSDGLRKQLPTLTRLVNAKVVEAERMKDRLQNSRDALVATVGEGEKVARVVVRTGSVSLLQGLEDVQQALHSQNLRDLLAGRRWEDYEGIVSEIGDRFRHLGALASEYAHQSPRAGHAAPAPDDVALDHAEACRVLGLPESATLTQIQKVYRVLAGVWHPDRPCGEEGRMKTINAAYEYLTNELVTDTGGK